MSPFGMGRAVGQKVKSRKQEGSETMKKSFAIVMGCAIALWLAVPAWAQRGPRAGGGAAMSARSTSMLGANTRHTSMGMKTRNSTSARASAKMRSNKGATLKGIDRADAVQNMNTRADTNRGFTTAPGLATATTKGAASANEAAGEHASAQAGSHRVSANATASEHMNARAQTNTGLSTEPGLATAATHTSASANSDHAAGASTQVTNSKKPVRTGEKGKTETDKH